VTALQDDSFGPPDRASLETLVVCMSPFAPHWAEECWRALGHEGTVFAAKWPVYDEAYLVDDVVEVVVQVNGRIRDRMEIARDAAAAFVEQMAKERSAVRRALLGKTVVKAVYVPGRLMNFVAK
jgi:leucyl-tRNA synthetase